MLAIFREFEGYSPSLPVILNEVKNPPEVERWKFLEVCLLFVIALSRPPWDERGFLKTAQCAVLPREMSERICKRERCPKKALPLRLLRNLGQSPASRVSYPSK